MLALGNDWIKPQNLIDFANMAVLCPLAPRKGLHCVKNAPTETRYCCIFFVKNIMLSIFAKDITMELKPEEPLVLSEGENVTVIIESRSDFSDKKRTSLSQIATRGPKLVEPPLSEIADEVHAYRKGHHYGSDKN